MIHPVKTFFNFIFVIAFYVTAAIIFLGILEVTCGIILYVIG